MSIDAIFLALDGVLFDTETLHLAACNAAFDEAGLSLRWDLNDLRQAARARGYGRAIGAAAAHTAAAGITVGELIALKHKHFHAAAACAPAVFPACLRLVDDALQAGCKLAVVTDMPAATGAALLERHFGGDVNSRFAVVAGDVEFEAPAGTGRYALALHALGVPAAACVALDSLPAGLRAAKAQGIWTVSTMPYERNAAGVPGADLWCPQLQELRHMLPALPARRADAQRKPFITFKTLGALKAHAPAAAGC